jgi:uncharacterized membrane protein YgdD (TMEM256/DUF423 family)
MTGMSKFFGVAGALFGLLGVGLGAFAAHALEGRLESRHLDVFQTGVRYQLIHALALVLVAVLALHLPGRWTLAAGWAFTAGILIFSGSLYLLVWTGVGRWGAVTPFGGLAFLAGWIFLAIAFWRAA